MAASALACLACLASVAPSRTRAQPTGLLARYKAPASCPGPAELERRLLARIHHPEQLGTTRLSVQIEVQSERARGVIAFESGAQARTIEAESCSELVEALSLIAALMLEPVAESARPGPTTTPAVPARGDSPPRQNAAPERPSSGPEAPAPASPRVANAASGATPPPVMPTARAPSSPSRGGQRQPQLALSASGLLLTGLTPDVGAGLGAVAEYRLVGQQLGLLVRGGFRVLLPHAVHSEDGDVTFHWWSFAGSLCGTRPSGLLSVSGCGALELGQLKGRGSHTQNAQEAIRLWAALGPAALLRLRIWHPLFVQLGAELLFPLAHHHYLLADSTIHSVPWLTFRGELALGVQIW